MDIHSPENCTCFNIRKAARAVTQMYDDALKATGLRATQMPILAWLADGRSLTMTALAGDLGVDRTTLTRNLKPLLAQGLLKTVDGDDRRQRLIAVTDAGLAKLREAAPLWGAAQEQLTRDLGNARWQGMLGDLAAAAEAATAHHR